MRFFKIMASAKMRDYKTNGRAWKAAWAGAVGLAEQKAADNAESCFPLCSMICCP